MGLPINRSASCEQEEIENFSPINHHCMDEGGGGKSRMEFGRNSCNPDNEEVLHFSPINHHCMAISERRGGGRGTSRFWVWPPYRPGCVLKGVWEGLSVSHACGHIRSCLDYKFGSSYSVV